MTANTNDAAGEGDALDGMKYNAPPSPAANREAWANWKLHDCPDGRKCSASIPGGCASGWCAEFGISPDATNGSVLDAKHGLAGTVRPAGMPDAAPELVDLVRAAPKAAAARIEALVSERDAAVRERDALRTVVAEAVRIRTGFDPIWDRTWAGFDAALASGPIGSGGETCER